MTAEYNADSNSSTTRISDTRRRSGFGSRVAPGYRPACAQRAHRGERRQHSREPQQLRARIGGLAGRQLRDQQAVGGRQQHLGILVGRGRAGSLQELGDRRQVRLGPASRERLQRRAPGGLQQQRVAGEQRPTSRGRIMLLPRRAHRGRHGVIGTRRQPPPVVGDRVQADQIALGGQLQRRRQQLLLGVEVVGRRRQRQLGDLGHPAVRDRVGAGVGDDPQRRLEQRLAAGDATRASGGAWRLLELETDMLVQMYQQARDVSAGLLRAPVQGKGRLGRRSEPSHTGDD